MGHLPAVMIALTLWTSYSALKGRTEWKIWAVKESVPWMCTIALGEVGVVLGRFLGPEVATITHLAGGFLGEWLGRS